MVDNIFLELRREEIIERNEQLQSKPFLERSALSGKTCLPCITPESDKVLTMPTCVYTLNFLAIFSFVFATTEPLYNKTKYFVLRQFE